MKQKILCFILTAVIACNLFAINTAAVGDTSSYIPDTNVSTFSELKAAIEEAPTNVQYVIKIMNDITFEEMITIKRKNIVFTSDFEIIFYSAPDERHFHAQVELPMTLTFNNVILDGNNSYGGIHYGGDTLTINNLRAQNCYGSQSGQGACISSYGGGLTLNNCIFKNNTAYYQAGVILYQFYGTLSIYNCEFYNNTAQKEGGVIYSNHPTSKIYINDSIFEDNQSLSVGGGAISIYRGELFLKGVTFNNNKSNSAGGAIFNRGGNVSIKECDFSNNSADTNGGAISNTMDGASETLANMKITNSSIENNNALKKGGGIYNETNMTIDNTIIKYNNANHVGGGIYNTIGTSSIGKIIINNYLIDNNTSIVGANIYNEAGAITEIN